MILTTPEADELNFVFDSWAKAFRASKWAGCIPNNLYDQVSRACASEIIDRGARVTVAVEVNEAGERRICGYSVAEPKRRVLHWLYVKRDLRGLGIGKRLLSEVLSLPSADPTNGDGWTYSHKTNASDKFLRGMRWDPTSARVLVK